MRKIAICSLLLLMLPFSGRALAQDQPKTSPEGKASETTKAPEPPVHYYHLEFVVQELGDDGKPVNSRTYSTTINTNRHSEPILIRTGSRVPIATGASSADSAKHVDTQFQYLDVGVSFDIRDLYLIEEVSDQLAFFLNADISSLASTTRMGGPNGLEEPVIRENRWSAPVLIPIGKPTVVFTSDALDSKGGMQLSVTATRLQ